MKIIKRNKKRIIALLLCFTIITTATMTQYNKAQATGFGVGAAAGATVLGLSPAGILTIVILGLGVGVSALFLPTGHEIIENKEEYAKSINEAGEKVVEDFKKHTIQAIKNNELATTKEIGVDEDTIGATIKDWLEDVSHGIIDKSSIVWKWFLDFVKDLKSALSGKTESSGGTGGDITYLGAYPKFQVGEFPLGKSGYWADYRTGYCLYYLCIEDANILQGEDVVLAMDTRSVVVHSVSNPDSVVKVSCSYHLKREDYDENGVKTHTYDNYGGTVTVNNVSTIMSQNNMSGLKLREYSIAEWDVGSIGDIKDSTVTDIPGVSDPSIYQNIGNDLPYSDVKEDYTDVITFDGDDMFWDDLPGMLGYDDWSDFYDALVNGDTTWEDVANAPDVIVIGSDTADSYDTTNADEWSAYIPVGSVTSIDIDEAGNLTITLDDGRVITVPAEYADSVSFVADGVSTPVSSDIPVSGSLVIPLPYVLDSSYPSGQDPSEKEIEKNSETSDYVLDFRKLFPFCIPFDIYNFVNCLDADPEAPVIDYPFKVMDKTYVIKLDLNKFNSVAKILRTMEMLLFIIGLAAATRQIYLRG